MAKDKPLKLNMKKIDKHHPFPISKPLPLTTPPAALTAATGDSDGDGDAGGAGDGDSDGGI